MSAGRGSSAVLRLGGHRVAAYWTDRSDGDLAGADRLEALGAAWLSQQHGAAVVAAGGGARGSLGEADAITVAALGTAPAAPVLAIRSADCGALALLADDGSYGAAHVGWRGLVSDVVASTASSLRSQGATRIVAALGPVIGVECYEFGQADLEVLVGTLGGEVAAKARGGGPALDLREGIRRACAGAGIDLVHTVDVCTACSTAHFSHRARADRARAALLCGPEEALDRALVRLAGSS